MVFSSLVFLFVFLPLVLAGYALCGRKLRNLVLLAASLFFYAWGEGLYVVVMALSILANYLLGLLIDGTRGKGQAQRILGAGVALNLALLITFKYLNFLVDSINPLLTSLSVPLLTVSPIHLPIGISFITFHSISYLVDVFRKQSPAQRSLVNIGLYITLFPQLIAGPIIRFRDVAAQIVERSVGLADVGLGIRRFVFGLAKKVLIANVLAETADKIFAIPPEQLPGAVAWLGAACYTLQIFFDFSGYSDMAIGLARIFGFVFLENFNYPYISQSIREFWRRWHISLSNWFKDYLYIPLGGNRKGSRRTYLNLIIVFFLCGLWHGASWNFIVWGLLHGLFIVLEMVALEKFLQQVWRPLRHAYALLVVVFGWILFRAESMPAALGFMAAMTGFVAVGEGNPHTLALYCNRELIAALVAGVLFSTPVVRLLGERMPTWRQSAGPEPSPILLSISLATGEVLMVSSLFVASACYLAAGSYNPFIYFRF